MLSCSTEKKSSDFRSFPPIQVQSAIWQEMRLAWSPLVHGALALWVSRFLLTTYSSPLYSLPLELILPLLKNCHNTEKKAWEGDFIIQWLLLQSCCLSWGGGKELQMIVSVLPPALSWTSALGPNIRWILYGELFRISSNCSTAPCPKTGRLRGGPNCVTSADMLRILYKIRTLASMQMILFLCFCSLPVCFAYHLFKEEINWKNYWKVRKSFWVQVYRRNFF